MNLLLLSITIILSAVRNILSKGISELKFGTKEFFLTQAVIFICGCFVLVFFTHRFINIPSAKTLLYAVIYSILLLSAQYCYTAALEKGNIGICSTIYSFGFIFPTISGSIFRNEKITILNIIGIIMVIPIIVISGMSPSENEQKKSINTYILPAVLAMLSSGGLGIMQKIQQSSSQLNQNNMFLILAFALAGIVSLLISLFIKKKNKTKIGSKLLFGVGTGAAFGFCNLLNTILAGRLDSAVFFPVLNIGTILLSVVSEIALCKENISKKASVILIMASISVILITST